MKATTLVVRLLAAGALALCGACSVSASGQIPCADDSSCPADYPVCQAGRCVESASGVKGSVQIVGVPGKAATDPVRGTVDVQVVAKASSGVKTLTLDGGGKSYSPDASSTPPVFVFVVDTTKLTDGSVQFTSTLTPGDPTQLPTTSGQFSLSVDNTAPVISAGSGSGAPIVNQTNASAGTTVTVDFRTNETSTVVATVDNGTQTLPMSEVDSGTAGVRRVAFSPSASTAQGLYRVTLTATDVAGNSTVVSDSTATPLKFNVVASPLAKSFSGPVIASSGASVTLKYDLSGGTAAINGSAGSGIPVSGLTGTGSATVSAPTVTTTTTVNYTLTVTNAAGVSVQATFSVIVVPVATATLVFTDSGGTVNNGTTINTDPHTTVFLKPTFAGGTATLNGAAVTSGSVIAVSNLTSTTAYSLAATNAAGLSTIASATATVNAKVNSFSVSPLFVTNNVPTTLTFTASHEGGGASGVAAGAITGPGIGTSLAIASGPGATAAVPGATLTSNATYTLTVNNSAGAAESPLATAGVTAVAPAVAQSFQTANSTSAITITQGKSTDLTGAFTNDAGGTQVVQTGGVTVGTISTSGGTVTVAPALGVTTYTLLVTNRAGQQSSQSVTVTAVAPPSQPTITPGASTVSTSVTGLVASVVGHSGYTYAWTVTGGTLSTGQGTSSITYTAPASPGTVLLSCDEVDAAGTHSAPGTALVTVVAAPVTPTITAILNGVSVTSVVANSTGNQASVTARPNMTYQWKVNNATTLITGGQGTATVTYTAPASGSAALSAVEVNQVSDQSPAATLTLAVVASSLHAISISAPPNVTAGTSLNAATILDQTTGLADVQAGTAFSWSISSNGSISSGGTANAIQFNAGAAGTDIALNASVVQTTPATGASASATAAVVHVVAPPQSPAITPAGSNFNVTAGATALTASVTANTGMTYDWLITGGVIDSGVNTATITYHVTGSAGGKVQLQCRETNVANTHSAYNSVFLDIYAAPQNSPAFSAPANTTGGLGYQALITTPGVGMQYNWTVNGVAQPGHTATLSFNAPASTTTSYTVTVTEQNPAGTVSATAGSATIANWATPAQPTISASPTTVGSKDAGRTASVTSSTSNLSFTWSVTGGTITGGQNTSTVTYTVTAAPGANAVQITATAVNPAGTSGLASAIANVTVAAGTYRTAVDLALARIGATVTRLADDRILIAGGSATVGGSPTNTAVICNSTGESCVATPNMGDNRMNHTATLLSSGKVLLAGGYNSATPTASGKADLYDPSAGTMTAVGGGGMNTARGAHIAVALNDGLVLFAGGSANGSTALSAVELFDPSSATFLAFTNSQTLKEPRMNFAAQRISNTTVLLIGSGTSGKGEVFDEVNTTSTTTVRANATFTLTSGLLNAVTTNLTATLLNGGTQVLIVGGHGASAPVSTAYLYTISTTAVAATGSLATARESHTATLLSNNKVLIAGGTLNGGASTAYSELYDSAGTAASVTGSMANARTQHSAALLADGEVLMVGGIAQTGGSIEAYQP